MEDYKNEDEKFSLPIDVETKGQSIDEQAENLCRWAAARSAVVVMLPFAGTVGLVANEVYMIKKIGELHGQELSESVILGFIVSLGATVIGSTIATIIPYSPAKMLVAVGLTYGIGKAAHEWLKAGRPDDPEIFKKVFADARDHAKRNVKSFLSNPNKDKPLGDETKKYDL